MVEAMATGTPVIAMNRGSVPEVVVDGETGFVCRSLDEMVAAVERVPLIDRRSCRQRVEQLFSVSQMADGYEAVYTRLLRCDSPRPMIAGSADGAKRDVSVA
jgi:glycosyltransferase involved in cell wall biosynthesis